MELKVPDGSGPRLSLLQDEVRDTPVEGPVVTLTGWFWNAYDGAEIKDSE